MSVRAWGARACAWGVGCSGGERRPLPCPVSRFRGKLTVFTVLCEQYQPSLRRDPMYNEVSGRAAATGGGGGSRPAGSADRPARPPQYLDRIGQLFFGVTPKQTSSYGGLLGKGHVHPRAPPRPAPLSGPAAPAATTSEPLPARGQLAVFAPFVVVTYT